MSYERLMGMGIESTSTQDCRAQRGQVQSIYPGDTTGKAEKLRLENCTQIGAADARGVKDYCCPLFGGASGIRGCPPGGLEYYLMNPGESMNDPCFDEGMVQRNPRGAWGRVWCCPPELRAIPSRHGASMLTEGERAYNQCVAQEGSVPAFEHPLTGKPANVADMDCHYSGRLVTEEHRRPVDAAERATALREMCCQPRSAIPSIPGIVSTGPASNGGNGGQFTTTHQVGGGALRVNWVGVAVLGMTGAFFWWFWKRFLPGMKAVAERDRQQALEQNRSRWQSRIDHRLSTAIMRNNVGKVRSLIAQGVDIHAGREDALKLASIQGHGAIVRLLLDEGAYVHTSDDLPLRLATREGHLSVVKVLLDYGANVHALDDEPIRIAADMGEHAIARLLLHHGADVNALGDEALLSAASRDDGKMVRLLLDYGADADVLGDWRLPAARRLIEGGYGPQYLSRLMQDRRIAANTGHHYTVLGCRPSPSAIGSAPPQGSSR